MVISRACQATPFMNSLISILCLHCKWLSTFLSLNCMIMTLLPSHASCPTWPRRHCRGWPQLRSRTMTWKTAVTTSGRPRSGNLWNSRRRVRRRIRRLVTVERAHTLCVKQVYSQVCRVYCSPTSISYSTHQQEHVYPYLHAMCNETSAVRICTYST